MGARTHPPPPKLQVRMLVLTPAERGAAKDNTKDETDVETNNKTVEPKDVTKNIAAKRTTNQEISTNAGLIQRTATKRKD